MSNSAKAAVALLADKDAMALLVQDGIDAIAKLVQDKIGQTDGGMASIYFSDAEPRDELENIIAMYLQHEAIGADDCEEIVVTSPAEWDELVKVNGDGLLDLGTPTFEAALEAAKGDGLYIGGGAAARFRITYREDIIENPDERAEAEGTDPIDERDADEDAALRAHEIAEQDKEA